jgi:capsular polysaccharide export protein
MSASPLLAIPPFPGARAPRFAEPGGHGIAKPGDVLAALAAHRVGGCYWGAQTALDDREIVLDGTDNPAPGAQAWDAYADPWPLLDCARLVRLPQGDSRALLALAARVALVLVAPDGSERRVSEADAEMLVASHLSAWRWIDPFDGRELSPVDAIALCGFWRKLIDANRTIHSVMGIAYWKKPTVTPLLWAGGPVPYGRSLDAMPEDAAVAIWRTRLTAAQQRELARAQPSVMEIEDGFIRSQGLGADCVPPLSIIVDPLGLHFAPGTPSVLESLLQMGTFAPELLESARSLREAIVAGGLSKYEASDRTMLPRPGGARRHVLVPGQVEDDRAVTSGGALASNLELLRRARVVAGRDAYLIYKPHPDVLAGHRRGAIADGEVAVLADQVDTTSAMPALLEMVDELHVNSSLAGFEALLRGKPVTVHGVPFYAGWGLTTDLGPVPARRTTRRTLDELVAAALLQYPRYLDPVTGLPCPAGVLVERLAAGAPSLGMPAAAVVTMRRAVGRINRMVRS